MGRIRRLEGLDDNQRSLALRLTAAFLERTPVSVGANEGSFAYSSDVYRDLLRSGHSIELSDSAGEAVAGAISRSAGRIHNPSREGTLEAFDSFVRHAVPDGLGGSAAEGAREGAIRNLKIIYDNSTSESFRSWLGTTHGAQYTTVNKGRNLELQSFDFGVRTYYPDTRCAFDAVGAVDGRLQLEVYAYLLHRPFLQRNGADDAGQIVGLGHLLNSALARTAADLTAFGDLIQRPDVSTLGEALQGVEMSFSASTGHYTVVLDSEAIRQHRRFHGFVVERFRNYLSLILAGVFDSAPHLSASRPPGFRFPDE
jgi:hypothetical protein